MKDKQATKLAIEAIEYMRRAKYSQGHVMYKLGHRKTIVPANEDIDEFEDGGWIEEAHEQYEKCTEAIEIIKERLA